MKNTKNYSLFSIGELETQKRVELHDNLKLTGAEISINELLKGESVPFVHAHKENEEIYIVLKGNGELYIDGEIIKIKEGDTLRINTKGERCFKASPSSSLRYICVQVKENTLTQFTYDDGIILETKAF